MQPTRPELTGTFGMVASTHWLASACGMAVLEAGGNAFDAAVAAGFVLQVVEPHMNGPAGEVPILLWSEADQAVSVVCGQGVAPAAATPEHFADLGLAGIPGTGLLPATVPGAFGGWMLLLERWGTWSVRDVLSYAIGYATDGFPVAADLAGAVRALHRIFEQDWPTSAATWLPGGQAPPERSRFRLPALAATYRRLVAEAEAKASTREGQIEAAVDCWYRGFVAEAIGAFAMTSWPDTSDEPHRGLLTADDLAGWQATVERSASYDYGSCTVHKTGPWGQGPVFLGQLALLDALDLAAVEPGAPEFVHLVVEASKLAFADREAWFGDDGEVPDLVAALTDPAYAAARAALVGPEASTELRPGSIGGRTPRLPTVGDLRPSRAGHLGSVAATIDRRAGAGEPTRQAAAEVRGDTCHLDVVDRHGNMVSATPSGGWLQSSPTIPDLGFCLGTRGQMFWLEPGLPSSLRPGKRPRTTLSPGLAFRDGEPWLAFGTPGGDQQDQWPLQAFLALVHGDRPLQAAVDAPAYHSEHVRSSFYPRAARPNGLVVEDRLGPTVIEDLVRRGHDVAVTGPWLLGRTCAVARSDGMLQAAANARGAQAYAVGR
jgi:gamma-glutamyltranspeptidase/glutathione hydrolase